MNPLSQLIPNCIPLPTSRSTGGSILWPDNVGGMLSPALPSWGYLCSFSPQRLEVPNEGGCRCLRCWSSRTRGRRAHPPLCYGSPSMALDTQGSFQRPSSGRREEPAVPGEGVGSRIVFSRGQMTVGWCGVGRGAPSPSPTGKKPLPGQRLDNADLEQGGVHGPVWTGADSIAR